MIRPKSIHWSLQFWHIVMICLCIPGLVYLGHYLHKTATLRKVDHELSMELNVILEQWVALPKRKANHQLPATTASDRWFICWGTKGNYFAHSTNAPKLPHPEGLEQSPLYTEANGYRILYHFGPRKKTIYAVGMPMQPIEEQINLGLLIFAGGGILLGGFAIAGGYFSNLKALRPLDDISKKAAMISEGDYHQRIDVSQAKDELVGLCRILNKAFDHIDHTLDIQRQFTSNASHELRTPISILLLELESAVDNDLPKEELNTRLKHCISTAKKMENLANSMLKIARLESGEIQLRKSPVDLATFISGHLDSLRSLTEQKSIDLQHDLQSLEIEVDTGSLSQVITNLISNAVSHTPEGGVINVKLCKKDSHAEITLSDTGSGIPATDLPHIFNRFYRADKARAASENRSGLGLAICQSIIHAHHGTIHIDSTEGEGTTVSIQLPL